MCGRPLRDAQAGACESCGKAKHTRRQKNGDRVGQKAEEPLAGPLLDLVGDLELGLRHGANLAAAFQRQLEHPEVGAAQIERVEVALLLARHPLGHVRRQHAHRARLASQASLGLRDEVGLERAHRLERKAVRGTQRADRL
jgi:hypothetical protein